MLYSGNYLNPMAVTNPNVAHSAVLLCVKYCWLCVLKTSSHILGCICWSWTTPEWKYLRVAEKAGGASQGPVLSSSLTVWPWARAILAGHWAPSQEGKTQSWALAVSFLQGDTPNLGLLPKSQSLHPAASLGSSGSSMIRIFPLPDPCCCHGTLPALLQQKSQIPQLCFYLNFLHFGKTHCS